MSLAVHLALVFDVFIAVAVIVMVCDRHCIGPVMVPMENEVFNFSTYYPLILCLLIRCLSAVKIIDIR